MPLFGAHNSIAGGYYKAAESARELKSDTVQLFTKNNNQWKGKPITDEEARLFQQSVADASLRLPMAHAAYLINLASPSPPLFEQSLEAFVEEVQRAEKLGLAYLVVHPGAATDGDEDAGLRRIAGALDETHRRCKGFQVRVLLENTAGQGSALGHRFEHLRRILDEVRHPERLGVCLDTCHLLAAGYPLAKREEYEETFDSFDRIVGLNRLCAFHVNDSKKPLGSRVDRHEHIGKGCIGLAPFRMLVNDARFQNLPMVLETPKEDEDGEPTMDAVNLRVLRKLCVKDKK